MARLRYNGLSGNLGGALSTSGTAITFAAALTHSNGTAVPTIVAGDYIPIAILDSNGHLSEIVWLTAYTAGATTGTIVRGKEGTSGVSHSSGDRFGQGSMVSDFTQAFPVGSADQPPSPPNAKDDEFDGTSTVSWTTTPTAPNASDINSTAPGCMYCKASGSGAVLVGKYQAVPGAYPFTITTKVTSTGRIDFHKAGGIFLVGATPTNSSQALILSHTGRTSATAGIQRTLITLGGTFTSETTGRFLPVANGPMAGARYLRVKVNSATSVDTLCSVDGKAWHVVESGLNPGFTPAFMGLACSEESGAGGVEAYFDFFRVT